MKKVIIAGVLIAAVIAAGCGKTDTNGSVNEQEAAIDARGEVLGEKKEPEKNMENPDTEAADNSVTTSEDKAEGKAIENDSFKPGGIIIDGEDMLITDTYYDAIWKYDGSEFTKIAGAESVEDIYGSPLGGYNDGDCDKALFADPFAITPFKEGYVVSDVGNDVLRYIHNDTVETVNAAISENGKETLCEFDNPTGLATGIDGKIYVSNTEKGEIIRISEDGSAERFLVNLTKPIGLCISDGYLYIAETGTNRILRSAIKDDKAGIPDVFAGSGEEGIKDGKSGEAMFSSPKSLFMGNGGELYVADTVNAAIRCIKDGEVSTIIEGNTGEVDAIPVSPTGLCIKDNIMYVCDNFNGKIYEFEMEKVQ